MTPGAPLCTGGECMERRWVPTAPLLLAAVTENTVFPTLAPGSGAGSRGINVTLNLNCSGGKSLLHQNRWHFWTHWIFLPPTKQSFACKFVELLHSQLKLAQGVCSFINSLTVGRRVLGSGGDLAQAWTSQGVYSSQQSSQNWTYLTTIIQKDTYYF